MTPLEEAQQYVNEFIIEIKKTAIETNAIMDKKYLVSWIQGITHEYNEGRCGEVEYTSFILAIYQIAKELGFFIKGDC